MKLVERRWRSKSQLTQKLFEDCLFLRTQLFEIQKHNKPMTLLLTFEQLHTYIHHVARRPLEPHSV